jgi:DNA polymerase-3 subunit beta
MYLKIYSQDVIDGLQKAANIIPQRTGAAYLRTIWLKAENGHLELLATDSNLEFRGSYPAEILEPGLTGVQGRSFVELLRRLPPGHISLKVDAAASVLLIEQGRRKYKLTVHDSSWFQNFSDFPEKGAVIWSGDYLQELIEKIFYCLGDEATDALSCLILKPAEDGFIEAAGMNGHQFSLLRFAHDDLRSLLPPGGILIQKKYLGELKKWLGTEEISLNLGEKRLFLRTEKKRESLSLPLSSYQYPDYSAFLGRVRGDSVYPLVLDRKDAQDALLRIAIFNSESNKCAYFDFSANEIVLSATGQEVGSASESLDVEYTGSISRIAFPTNHLLTIFDHFSSARLTLALTGTEGPCGITGEEDPSYLVIIMPMKILDDTLYQEEQV